MRRRQNFSSLQTFGGPKHCFGDSPGGEGVIKKILGGGG